MIMNVIEIPGLMTASSDYYALTYINGSFVYNGLPDKPCYS